MTNPADPDSALADLFGVRRPTVLPLESDALEVAVDETSTVSTAPPVQPPPAVAFWVSISPDDPDILRYHLPSDDGSDVISIPIGTAAVLAADEPDVIVYPQLEVAL